MNNTAAKLPTNPADLVIGTTYDFGNGAIATLTGFGVSKFHILLTGRSVTTGNTIHFSVPKAV